MEKALQGKPIDSGRDTFSPKKIRGESLFERGACLTGHLFVIHPMAQSNVRQSFDNQSKVVYFYIRYDVIYIK